MMFVPEIEMENCLAVQRGIQSCSKRNMDPIVSLGIRMMGRIVPRMELRILRAYIYYVVELVDMRNDLFERLAREAEEKSFKLKYSSYQNARVCSNKVYKTIKSSDQTNTCAELAARYYYNKLHPGRFLMDVVALDSHTFDRQTEDQKDPNAYYHVNFEAKIGTRDRPPSLFFAELQGTDGPEKVNLCTELDWSEDLENCEYCTGITHPVNNFVGCMHPCKRNK